MIDTSPFIVVFNVCGSRLVPAITFFPTVERFTDCSKAPDSGDSFHKCSVDAYPTRKLHEADDHMHYFK